MDCIGIPQLRYDEFSKQFFNKFAGKRVPISGVLEVTSRCNLRCQHCYLPLKSRVDRRAADLPLQEIKRFIDEIVDLGCLWLLLTGGEPFLRPDMLEIYHYAKTKGLLLTLFTNGTLLTPRIVDFLAEWRPVKIEITLYGATQVVYERVTGIPGSFARCMRGIELLAERKLPFSLKTMLMTLNAHELDQMKAFANRIGVKFRFDPIVNPVIDGSTTPIALRLSPQEVVRIEKTDPGRCANWPEQFRQAAQVDPSNCRLFLCGAGSKSFFIDAEGRLSMCVVARNPSYGLTTGSFKEGWEQFLPRVIDRPYGSQFECAGCNLRTVCSQCPGLAELEHGDFEKRVDFICQVTKLRQAVFFPENSV